MDANIAVSACGGTWPRALRAIGMPCRTRRNIKRLSLKGLRRSGSYRARITRVQKNDRASRPSAQRCALRRVLKTRGELVEAQQFEQRRQVTQFLTGGRGGAADEVEDL